MSFYIDPGAAPGCNRTSLRGRKDETICRLVPVSGCEEKKSPFCAPAGRSAAGLTCPGLS